MNILSDGVYEKKYDLSAGTYYVRVNSPYQGRFQLKIGPDETPPNNKWIWTGSYELPFGATIITNEDSWSNAVKLGSIVIRHLMKTLTWRYPTTKENTNQKFMLVKRVKCKTIKIETNNGAKLSIEATGKLDVEN